jgi:YVTN family beta-propeller protein
MVELPTGTVTFLFTDIEGSTRLLRQLGARYDTVLADHQQILRDYFGAHRGREVDTQGDSFFVAFARAGDAVASAIDAQHALERHAWPDGVQVRVRMGLHSGEPRAAGERYVGFGVHRAARIGAAGHGGQVLLSNATRELVEDELPPEARLRDLGTYQLKDLDRPEHLFQLEAEGLPHVFPPLKAERVAAPHPLRRRSLLVAMLAGVVAAAVAIPIFALGQGGSDGESIDAAAGNSVGIIDPESNRLVADVAVGTTPTDVTLGDGAVWITNAADGTVDRIEPDTQTVRQTIRVGNGPSGIAFGAGSVWVANSGSGTVSRIDPRSSEVTETIPVGNGPSGIAVGFGKVWVVNRDDHTLSRIGPETGSVERTFTVGSGPVDVTAGDGGVWIVSQADGKILRIDPRTGAVLDSVPVGRGPGAIAAVPGAVWVANGVDGSVSRIDPETSAVTAVVPVGEGPTGIAAGDDAIWVSNQFDGSISRIDPAANSVSKSLSIGGSPVGIAVAPERVFVAVRPAAGAHQGGTLVVHDYAGVSSYESLDPAVIGTTTVRLGMVWDGLTSFRWVGGREGAEVVPDLAASLPEPSDAGRTYTFRLRKGVRYSTGKLVRPGDLRRALERTFAVQSYGAFLYESIVGADACLRRPKSCELSKGIEVDDRSGTVTFRLTKPDPEFFAKLALPFAVAVPEDTPGKDLGTRPLPATGPYRIAGYVDGREIRLVRNPHFKEWSHAARPEGYPDEIVIRVGVPVVREVQDVARGKADLADLGNSGFPGIARLRARYGSRLRSSPGPFVVYTFLNTRLSPFDDVRVRRALNFAIDRQAIARAAGPENATPTCHMLPQSYPGYRPDCQYERDLAQARQLVAESGTRGESVVVWTRASYQPFYSHVVDALRDLGYRARLEVVADRAYYDAIDKAGPETIQAGYIGWVTDYPSAFGYLRSLLGFLRTPPAQFSDNAVEREIERAVELQQTDPTRANELWAQIDRMILDRAPVVPMYDLRTVQLVSSRVGNYQYHPLWDVLLDQLWVR